MDDDKSSQFVLSLIKSIQALCQGFIDFNSSIEVIGHIHLNVDRGTKFDYVLTEEIYRYTADDSTLFSSHSYHSKPPPQIIQPFVTPVNNSKASSKSGSRRKSALIPRDIDNDSCSYTFSDTITPSTAAANSPQIPINNPQVPIGSDRNSPRIISVSTLAQPGNLQHKADVDDTLPPLAKRSCIDESLSKTVVNDSGPNLDMPDVKVKQEVCDEEDSYNSSTPDAGHVASDRAAAIQQLHQPFPLMLHVNPRQSDVPVPSTSGVLAPKPNVLITGPNVNLCLKSPAALKEGIQNHPNKDCVIRYFLKDGKLFPIISKDQRDVKKYVVKQKEAQPEKVTKQQSVTVKAESNLEAIETENKELSVKNERPDASDLGISASSGIIKNKVLKIIVKNVARKSTTSSKNKRISLQEHSGFHSRYKSTRKAKASLNKKVQRRYKASGYLDYTEEDINAAIDLVHKGMPVIEAALELGIPRATLFNRSREGCKSHTGRCSEAFRKSGAEFQKRRKHMQYTQEQFEKAIDAIHKGMPVIDASFLFKIPRATLFIRSSKGCPTHSGRCSTVFSHGRIHRTKVYKNKYRELMEISKSQEDDNDLTSKLKVRESRKCEDKHLLLDPSSGKFVNIPLKADPIVPLVDIAIEEGSQVSEAIDSEHQFETLTTSDSNLVFKRLKERMNSKSPSQRTKTKDNK